MTMITNSSSVPHQRVGLVGVHFWIAQTKPTGDAVDVGIHREGRLVVAEQ
jgi:hypothetical protein